MKIEDKVMELNINTCNRCGDEKRVNKHGLCESCNKEVDFEYAALYRTTNME